MDWIVLDVLIFGLLGALLGRGRFLIILLVASPIVVWWFWGAWNQGGPDDDATGPAATVLTLFGLIGVAAGIGIHQLARWVISARQQPVG
jgi:hypothetical protein